VKKRRILLLHWNPKIWEENKRRLSAARDEIVAQSPQGLGFLREVRRDPPGVVVIDLDRLPSVGREVALALRMSKATRYVPIVFAGGETDKVARVREQLQDAFYTSWDSIRDALKRAVVTADAEPIVPRSIFDTYSSVPLQKKLGIKENSTVAMIDAPAEMAATVGDLPDGASWREKIDRECDLIMWFVRSADELDRKIGRMAFSVGERSIWIVWPKKTSKIVSDLSQNTVRRVGLASGLVDYKVCAIDANWSGLLFRQRKGKSISRG
jgi:hypothetical protein